MPPRWTTARSLPAWLGETSLPQDDSEEPDATAAHAQVRSSLLRLPPEQRHTLEMSYFDAMHSV